MTFDQTIIEEAARLTALGMGTAFALLLAMTIIITLVGRIFRGAEVGLFRKAGAAPSEPSADAQEKALAAVVAVSAMLGKPEDSQAAG